jgi:tetratricopeptide (TPR) repeat protein
VILPAILLVTALGASAQEPVPSPAPEEEAATPADAPAAVPPAVSSGSAAEHVDAGLAAFRRRRFAAARDHFQQAVAADPNSAAAHFYLGYSIYKIAEPKRPFHPQKQEAAEHFAQAYNLDPTFKPVWHR